MKSSTRRPVDSDRSERTRKWREAKKRKEEEQRMLVEEQKRREQAFMGEGSTPVDLASAAWALVFSYVGFSRELAHCSSVCSQWHRTLTAEHAVLAKLHQVVFNGVKPDYLLWADVYNSFPSLMQQLTTLDLPRARLESFIWRTPWLHKGIKHDNSYLMKIVMEWSIIHGHEEIVQAVLGASPPARELTEYMSQYALSAGHRPPIVRCIANGHVKTAKWLFSSALPKLSPEDVSLFAASLLYANDIEIYETLALLPKIYTQKLVFNALLKGRLQIVDDIEKKMTKGDQLWKPKTTEDTKFYDLPDDASVFSFSEQESADLFIKYLQKEGNLEGEEAQLLAALKNLSVNSPTKKPEEIRKRRENVFAWLIKHNVHTTLPLARLIPALGDYEAYTCLIDSFPSVPPSLAFIICSNAQNQVDSMLFQYLIENNLVDGNAVDGEGNGLVYTAFVAANVSALNILAKHKADPNIFSLSSTGTTLFDLCLHSQKHKDIKSAVQLLLKFPGVLLPSPEILLLVDEATVKILLEAGVKADYTTPNGANLLQRALMLHATPSTIKRLIEHGARMDVPYPPGKEVAQKKGDEGSEESEESEDTGEEVQLATAPPMAIAFYYEQLGLVQYMLEKSADPEPTARALYDIRPSLGRAFKELLHEYEPKDKKEEKADTTNLGSASLSDVDPSKLVSDTLKFTYNNEDDDKLGGDLIVHITDIRQLESLREKKGKTVEVTNTTFY